MIITLIVLFLIARMLRGVFYRPFGGFWGMRGMWGFPGMWGMGMRRPPMHRPPMGGFGPGPRMGGPRWF